MQVKLFLYFAASLWKEDLMLLLGKSRFISKPHWSPTDHFLLKHSTFGQNYLSIANFSSVNLSFANLAITNLFIANLSPPLLNSPNFADRHPPLLALPSYDKWFFLC